MATAISYYCQKCLAANPLGQEFCVRCGTRLMIVVEPTSSRFEVGEGGLTNGDHLLERISAAENRISRLTDRLERSLDLLLRQAQNSYFDRSLVKALIDLLSEDGVVQQDRLETFWNERCQKDALEQEQSVNRDQLRTLILARSSGPTRQTFEQLVNEGFLLIEDHQVSRGMDALQRAAEISSNNAELNVFIGEHYFRTGKTKVARLYLSKAHSADPDNVHVALLLGLTYADDGETELAKALLTDATRRGGSSFAGHCGLGWLFATEKKWRRALSEFKQALNTRPSPEAHYILGAFYYEQNRDALALRHLRKAVEMDENYREAFYLLALIYQRGGEKALSNAAFESAEKALANVNRGGRTGPNPSPRSVKSAPLFQASGRPRRLITGADKRLAEALRNDALHAFNRTTPSA
jgi:tetratricopeptide (TPR) repeat protein